MTRTAGARWAAGTAGALALAMLATWIWWRESDTGERWRFDKAMESYCGGLLAHQKGPLSEGMWPGTRLLGDRALGPDAYTCQLGDWSRTVTVALLPADADEDLDLDLAKKLPHTSGDRLPVPLPGGWRGAADGDSVKVLLGCGDGRRSVAVTVTGYSTLSDEQKAEERRDAEKDWLDGDLYWSRFAVATAAKAADRWTCEAELGKPLTGLPAVSEEEATTAADGTCAGLPFALDPRLRSVHETTVSPDAITETCRVNATDHFSDPYGFSAAFGAYALRERMTDDRHGSTAGGTRRQDAGIAGGLLWGSARCPGDAERALFTGRIPPQAATVWAPGEKQGKETFGLPAFRAFAERSSARHGCTDLRLPAGS